MGVIAEQSCASNAEKKSVYYYMYTQMQTESLSRKNSYRMYLKKLGKYRYCFPHARSLQGILFATAYNAFTETPRTAVKTSLSDKFITHIDKLFGIIGHEYRISSFNVCLDNMDRSIIWNICPFADKTPADINAAIARAIIDPFSPRLLIFTQITIKTTFTTE